MLEIYINFSYSIVLDYRLHLFIHLWIKQVNPPFVYLSINCIYYILYIYYLQELNY